MLVLAPLHSLPASTAHDACSCLIVYVGSLVEVAGLRKAVQAREVWSESDAILEAAAELAADIEKALSDRNLRAHSWTGEVVCGCCSWAAVREVQDLDRKQAPSMVAHLVEHCSRNSSAVRGIAPAIVVGVPAAGRTDHLESLGRNAQMRLASSTRQAEVVGCFAQFAADCWVCSLRSARRAGLDVECPILVALKQPIFREASLYCSLGCLAKVFSSRHWSLTSLAKFLPLISRVWDGSRNMSSPAEFLPHIFPYS